MTELRRTNLERLQRAAGVLTVVGFLTGIIAGVITLMHLTQVSSLITMGPYTYAVAIAFGISLLSYQAERTLERQLSAE
jgi:hypothetical protein